MEFVAGTTHMSMSNISEGEKTQNFECQNNIDGKKQLKNEDVFGAKQIHKELLSVSDLTQITIVFTNVDDIKPQSAVNAK